MATSKLLRSSILRRRRPPILALSPSILLSHSSTDSPPPPTERHHHPETSPQIFPTDSFFRTAGVARFPSSMFPFDCSSGSRFYSTRPDSESESAFFEAESTQSELSDLGLGSVIDGVGGGEDYFIAVRALISFLDGVHDLTGLPWWMVIPISTLALRIALLPLLILQLHKLKRLGELFPKLPPPFPPPLSGRSYRDQFTLFQRERRAVGCPSPLWLMAFLSVQIPCFFLGVTSIRRMSLGHHPGFDSEGILWFQNLTELPHGVLGSTIPLLIACLHLANVEVSLRSFSMRNKTTGLFHLLLKCYKFYLRFLTVPILVAGFNLPQGSLVYWVTNSSISLIQQLALNRPDVRAKLGLPDKLLSTSSGDNQEVATPGMIVLDPPEKQRMILAENLSSHELVNLSIQMLAGAQQDKAITVLRLALDKDPEYVRALIILGQTLLQKGLLIEAIHYFERAITKLLIMGQPTEVEDIDLLILASQWAGSAYARQGKYTEGLVHLERIAQLEEPQDTKSKAHYYDGLLFLVSALVSQGRNADAEKYVQMLVAYDPAYNKLFKDLGVVGEDNFIDELADSRRRDY